ncbi:alanine racemase [Sphingomonas sp. UV9]|uniref:diaminopimelate decarboxylase family protein n=1 Tax=Sphingomonas sp. UV9 TaxID=1851410 RepID=UPI0013E8C9D4|nr:alanine racemase [Sphingomonas sp. UV9]
MLPKHVADIAQTIGEPPTYIYDLAVLRERLARVEQLVPCAKRIFFATMANDHPAFLGEVRRQGAGVFINSPRHLRLAINLGFAPADLIYAASYMSVTEMDECLQLGVHVVLDSLDQVAHFAARAPDGTRAGIRVNVGSALDGKALRDDPDYRFGLLPAELGEAVATAAASGLRLVGVHSYFGTDIRDPDILLEGLRRLLAAGAALPDIEYVDGGGGFGIPDTLDGEEFDLAAYGEGAAAILGDAERALGRSLVLYLEPGRYVSAPCGWFFARAIGAKPRADRLMVGLSASAVQLPRLLLHPDTAQHPWHIVGRERDPPHAQPVWLCGNSTYSRDFLARACRSPAPVEGDLVVFHNAGAYGRSMLTEFLGKDRPVEIVLDAALVAAAQLPNDATAVLSAS